MFDIVGSKSIFDKVEIKSITINEASTTIAFQEGFSADDVFVSVGYDHIELFGESMTSFLSAFTADNSLTTAETFVQSARPGNVVNETPQEEI